MLSVLMCGGPQCYAHSLQMELWRLLGLSSSVCSGRSTFRSMCRSSVLEYQARFVELSKYAPHIVADERRKVKKFIMGLKPSLRTRLVALGHHSMEEALSTACMQEAEMEREWLQRHQAEAQLQRSHLCAQCGTIHEGERLFEDGITNCSGNSTSSSETGTESNRETEAQARVFALARDEVELAKHVIEGTMKDYDAILGFDWLEEHYALMDCRRKLIIFQIPGKEEFVHPLPKNMSGKFTKEVRSTSRSRASPSGGNTLEADLERLKSMKGTALLPRQASSGFDSSLQKEG
ncbi:hypothetical protein Taro_007865 [Colocasia esculenta]|uniref:Uncharacterized protein n=1 Tax=Colocasia esculenta TaxID=4460 RepID=A0A843TW44_COLES|nr:hypothetical protein [Colocasia esculenta]